MASRSVPQTLGDVVRDILDRQVDRHNGFITDPFWILCLLATIVKARQDHPMQPPAAGNALHQPHRCMRSALAASLFVAFVCASAHAERLAGRVVGIQDGDTLTLLDANRRELRIRLAGIDAPEARQRYGQASRRALSAEAFGKEATANCPKTDKYGRKVCVVTVGGRDVGLALLEAGAAWHFKAFAQEQTAWDRQRYARAEEDARRRRAGLWEDPEAVPPWEWRRGVRVPD